MKSFAFGFFFFNLILVSNLQSQYLIEEFRPRIKSAAHNAGHVLQDDGKIVMLGDYAFVGDSAVANLLRFHPDGSLDKDFVLDDALTDMFTTDFGSCCSQSSVIQGVGSDLVLMTADFPRKAIIIDESGQFKAEIPTPTGYIQIERIVAHYDGYIAVFHKFVSEQSVFRLDHEGNVDPDFTRLDYTGYIPEMRIDASGNIVLVGDITIGETTKNLVRISESGVLDNSFNNISFIPNFPELDFFPDGKILLSSYTYIALLDADGYPIDTFVPDTGGHPIYSSVVDPVNNRIIVLMDPYPLPNVVKALELDGSVSEDFVPISTSSTNTLTNIYRKDEKFVLVGRWELEYESASHSFLLFDALGGVSTDISTRENLSTVGQVNTAVGLEDGSIIIGGKFSHIGNTQVNNLAKLDRSGNVDEDFNLNNPLSLGDDVRKIEISSDNKMYVGGFFKNILDNPQNSLIRMSLEGELDLSFSTNLTSSGSEEFLNDFVIMDDRIIASGAYYQRVVAFDFDGDEISSFNGDIFEEPFVSVKSICVVDEDNFAISGVDLNGDGFLWVMDPDGNIDNSFARKDDIPISSEHIVRVGQYLYRSGKILGGQSSGDGDFIYRYNLETGDIDQSALSTYTISENRHLLALNDTVVLISGRFDRFNTTEAHNFAASNFEGQAYERLKFDISPGIKGYDLQRTVAISNEEVLLLGQFNSINGKPFYSIALLHTTNFTPEMSLNESYHIPEDTSFYAVDMFGIIDLDDEVEISAEDNEDLFIDENGLISLQDHFHGSTELIFTLSDSFGQHGPFSTTLNVFPVNDAPFFDSVEDQVVTAGAILQIAIFVQDVDNDNIMLTATSSDQTIMGNEDIIVTKSDSNNFSVTLTPDADIFGQTLVNLIASDGIVESTGSFNLEVQVGNLTGISDNNEVRIFPNPVRDIMWVEKTSGFGGNSKFTINGLNGKVLYAGIVEEQYEIAISMNAFPEGVYFLTLFSDDGRIVKKIVKD